MEWNFKLRDVPEEFHRRVKVAAAQKGETLQQFVLNAIRSALEADSKKTRK